MTTTESTTTFQNIKEITESTPKKDIQVNNEPVSVTTEIDNSLQVDDVDLNFERQKLHFLMTLPVETTKSTPIRQPNSPTKGKT